MVLINMKINDKNQFLYETTTTALIEDTIKDLVLSK
jgi:hypothetical protein